MRSKRGRHLALSLSASRRLELATILLLLLRCVDIEGSQSSSSESEGTWGWPGHWWSVNGTNETNFTELCSGAVVINSSIIINSSSSSESWVASGAQNTSNGSFVPCNIYAKCRERGLITVETDEVTYVDANSTIVVTVDSNITQNHTHLYYRLCYGMQGSDDDGNSGGSEVVECTVNGTALVSQYRWRRSGEAVLTAHLYTGSNFSDSEFVDCGYANVTVASNFGLKLQVKLFNEPTFLDKETEASYHARKEEKEEEEEEEEDEDEEDLLLLEGNVTFMARARLVSGVEDDVEYFYTFELSGPTFEERVWSQQPNWTWEVFNLGQYSYTVDAFARLDSNEAHHANLTGQFRLLEGLSETIMQVGGKNNSVKVGAQEEITISADGSTPISVCWSQTKINSTKNEEASFSSSSFSPTNQPPGGDPSIPLKDCIVLNSSNATVFRENRTFNVVGEFQFVAHFNNGASEVDRNFTFKVYSGPSPSVLASSATAAVIVAVLVAVVVLIVALVAGGYIPYRRYKNRMTETADFRFVDLSEEKRSNWENFKRRANQILRYFRRKHQNEKIGLVNLGAASTEERQLLYGTNTLTQFAPYETI